MKFGIRLKELRIENKLTQRAFAEKLGVHYSSIRDWETGGRQTSFEMLVKIADYFKVTTDYLLGRTDDY